MRELFLIIIVMLACSLLKYIFRRERPYVHNLHIKNYDIALGINDRYSFPSNHTLIITLLCLIIIGKYPQLTCLYIVPLLVGFSRVIAGVHYPSDVIGGWIIGYTLYKLLFSNNTIVK